MSEQDVKTVLETMLKLSSIGSQIESRRQEVLVDLVRAKTDRNPAKLYHYTNLQGVEGILESNNLWATDFRHLNDTHELRYGASLLVEELLRFGARHGGDVSTFLQKIANFYHEHGDIYRQFFETYIICFSEDHGIISQWLAYADRARGHCIEFDLSDSRLFTILGSKTPWAMEVSPVLYEEKTQRLLVERCIERLVAYLNSTKWTISNVVAGPEEEQFVILGFLMHVFEPFVTSFKHSKFASEREWRAVASCQSHLTQGHQKQAIGGKSYIDCIFVQGDEINLWQRPYLPITKLIHGPLAKPEEIAELETRIASSGYADLIVREFAPMKVT